MNSAESWTFQKVYLKYLGSFEMWRWRRVEEISWNDHVKNVEVLQSHAGKENPTYNKKREG